MPSLRRCGYSSWATDSAGSLRNDSSVLLQHSVVHRAIPGQVQPEVCLVAVQLAPDLPLSVLVAALLDEEETAPIAGLPLPRRRQPAPGTETYARMEARQDELRPDSKRV